MGKPVRYELEGYYPPDVTGRFALLQRKNGTGAELFYDFGEKGEIRFPQPLYCFPDYAPEHRGCWLAWNGGGRVFVASRDFTASPAKLAQKLLNAGFVFNAAHARLFREYAAACYGERRAMTKDGAAWAEPALLERLLSEGGE